MKYVIELFLFPIFHRFLSNKEYLNEEDTEKYKLGLIYAKIAPSLMVVKVKRSWSGTVRRTIQNDQSRTSGRNKSHIITLHSVVTKFEFTR